MLNGRNALAEALTILETVLDGSIDCELQNSFGSQKAIFVIFLLA
jgi:hypothetical protein